MGIDSQGIRHGLCNHPSCDDCKELTIKDSLLPQLFTSILPLPLIYQWEWQGWCEKLRQKIVVICRIGTNLVNQALASG